MPIGMHQRQRRLQPHCSRQWLVVLFLALEAAKAGGAGTSVDEPDADHRQRVRYPLVHVHPEGADGRRCGTREGSAGACRTLRHALDMVSEGGLILMAPGRYPTLTRATEVHATVVQSVRVAARAAGKPAVIDCERRGSGVDILLRAGMQVKFSNVVFRYCSGARRWDIGPIPSWCARGTQESWKGLFGCGCSLQFCSKGGAITITNATAEQMSGVQVVFDNCAFEGNSADRGGAVQIGLFRDFVDSQLVFRRCRFEANVARVLGGSAIDVLVNTGYVPGYYSMARENGGLNATYRSVILSSVWLSLRDTRFVANRGKTEGTVAVWGVGNEMDGFKTAVVRCEFVDNVGGNGGALAFHFPTPVSGLALNNSLTVSKTRFLRNRALHGSVGGAIMLTVPKSATKPDIPVPLRFRHYDYKVQLVTVDSEFVENEAHVGGAYAISNGWQVLRNVTFLRNRAANTGGAMCLGCVGGGDARLDAHSVLFRGNTAAVAGSAFSSAASGRHSFVNCTFDLEGSQEGLTDFEATNTGPFWADGMTTWRCRENQQLLKPAQTMTRGISGVLKEEWNRESISVLLNHFHVSCFWCAPLTYSVVKPVLWGPVASDVDEGGHGFLSQGEFESRACKTCPFGGTCTGNASVALARAGQFGLACVQETPEPVLEVPETGCSNWESILIEDTRSANDAESCGHRCLRTKGCIAFNYRSRSGEGNWSCPGPSGACSLFKDSCKKQHDFCWDLYYMRSGANVGEDRCHVGTHADEMVTSMKFFRCPPGYCSGGPWYHPCSPGRTGLLCGSCLPDHSRALGTTECVPDEKCNFVWILPLLVLLSLYAAYCYVSAANLYSLYDMFIFHYQIYGYAVFSQSRSAVVAAWLSSNFDIISFGAPAKVGTRAVCIIAGLDQVQLTACSYFLAGAVLVFIVSLHVFGFRRLLPSSWSVNCRPSGESLLLALVKGYLGIYNTVIGATVRLTHCLRLPGITSPRLFTAADTECYQPWQFGLLCLLPLLLLSEVLPIALAAQGGSCSLGGSVRMRPRSSASQRRRRALLRLREVAEESGMFRPECWWTPHAFALSRALFAVITGLCATSAERALFNSVLLLVLLVGQLVIRPFKQLSVNIAQSVLMMLLQVVSIYQVGQAFLVTTAATAWQTDGGALVQVARTQLWFEVVALASPALALLTLLWLKRRAAKADASTAMTASHEPLAGASATSSEDEDEESQASSLDEDGRCNEAID